MKNILDIINNADLFINAFSQEALKNYPQKANELLKIIETNRAQSFKTQNLIPLSIGTIGIHAMNYKNNKESWMQPFDITNKKGFTLLEEVFNLGVENLTIKNKIFKYYFSLYLLNKDTNTLYSYDAVRIIIAENIKQVIEKKFLSHKNNIDSSSFDISFSNFKILSQKLQEKLLDYLNFSEKEKKSSLLTQYHHEMMSLQLFFNKVETTLLLAYSFINLSSEINNLSKININFVVNRSQTSLIKEKRKQRDDFVADRMKLANELADSIGKYLNLDDFASLAKHLLIPLDIFDLDKNDKFLIENLNTQVFETFFLNNVVGLKEKLLYKELNKNIEIKETLKKINKI